VPRYASQIYFLLPMCPVCSFSTIFDPLSLEVFSSYPGEVAFSRFIFFFLVSFAFELLSKFSLSSGSPSMLRYGPLFPPFCLRKHLKNPSFLQWRFFLFPFPDTPTFQNLSSVDKDPLRRELFFSSLHPSHC